MNSAGNTKTIVFSNSSHSGIPQLVAQVFDAVKELLPSLTGNTLLLHKIKWTITELVINGLKHAAAPTTITVSLNDNLLTIEKTDAGNIFTLPINNGASAISWPLPHPQPGTTFFIYPDPGSYLYATITNDTARFWISEDKMPEVMADDHETVHEHFGLLIITKSADEFLYHYNKEKRLNVFTCHFFI